MIRKLTLLSLILCLAVAPTLAQQPATQTNPALSVAKTFGSHMVLQQGKVTTIFGNAKADTPVSLEFAGKTHKSSADDKGEWSIALEPMSTNATGQSMTIASGGEKLVLEDILIGEVWMCSGQSNMQWSLNKSDNWEAAAKIANYPKLRFFKTPNMTAASPQRDVTGGEWHLCTPESAPAFSAVGFYFGRELLEKMDTPIGLINTAWGGKPSEAFTSREAMLATPSAKRLVEEWDAKQASFDPDAAKANHEKSMAAWQKRMDDFRAAKKAGKNPDQKKVGRKPSIAQAPNLAPNCPAAIYNQMIKPWNTYAIAGAIWYQGESNGARGVQYETMFPAMIQDWRTQRKNDFPFYLVQLANFKTASTEPGTPSPWAELQNAQTLTLQKLKNTGIAIINDIGAAKDIHPRNKLDVGKRLSRWALAKHYGKSIDGPVSGPIYKSHEIVGSDIRVQFDYADGLKSRNGGDLKRFEIAGADKKWVWADAKIEADGKSVLISSTEVEKPAAARYAWAANPEGANLVNSAGLPASLFRTDDWPLSSEGVETLADSNALRQLANLDKAHKKLSDAGWEVLFNGKDLSGWKNPYEYGEATVKFGEIHLAADKKFFLVTEKTYKDFILQLEIKLPEGKANSGVMFRAHVEPGKVYGYQAECDGSDRRWSGGLYDEGRRKWIWPSQKGKSQPEFLAHSEKSLAHMATPKVAGALKRNDWNKYHIACRGNSIQIRVNGVVVTKINDDMDAEGYIGIQHHGEKGAIYKFRNIYLREYK